MVTASFTTRFLENATAGFTLSANHQVMLTRSLPTVNPSYKLVGDNELEKYDVDHVQSFLQKLFNWTTPARLNDLLPSFPKGQIRAPTRPPRRGTISINEYAWNSSHPNRLDLSFSTSGDEAPNGLRYQRHTHLGLQAYQPEIAVNCNLTGAAVVAAQNRFFQGASWFIVTRAQLTEAMDSEDICTAASALLFEQFGNGKRSIAADDDSASAVLPDRGSIEIFSIGKTLGQTKLNNVFVVMLNNVKCGKPRAIQVFKNKPQDPAAFLKILFQNFRNDRELIESITKSTKMTLFDLQKLATEAVFQKWQNLNSTSDQKLAPQSRKRRR